MLLTAVSDVTLPMVPDVTRMALPYCAWGLSMAQSILGTLGRMSFCPRWVPMHVDECTLVLGAEVSDKLLLRCREALDIEGHDTIVRAGPEKVL